jgi:hypothetical protein
MSLWDYSITSLRTHLEARGYNVTSKLEFEWETPTQFSVRHGKGKTWFSKCRSLNQKIPPFERDTTDGRLVHLRSNPMLEAWAERGKQ